MTQGRNSWLVYGRSCWSSYPHVCEKSRLRSSFCRAHVDRGPRSQVGAETYVFLPAPDARSLHERTPCQGRSASLRDRLRLPLTGGPFVNLGIYRGNGEDVQLVAYSRPLILSGATDFRCTLWHLMGRWESLFSDCHVTRNELSVGLHLVSF